MIKTAFYKAGDTLALARKIAELNKAKIEYSISWSWGGTVKLDWKMDDIYKEKEGSD